MPYDISQLNDMLVPELVDVAENLKINNARSLDKQTLIYKILDQQAVANGGDADSDAKKSRARKPKTESMPNKSKQENAEDNQAGPLSNHADLYPKE